MSFSSIQTTLALGMPGPMEWIIIGIIGVLIFGKRLPSVGKSLGQGIVEFKKGLSGVKDELDDAVNATKSLDDPSSSNASTMDTPETKAETPSTPPHSA
ncbi:Sec-independent protein translocase subunit TatA/TatB [Algisphaera agarilytica]|uniref:Sec-independent protein translocase protein TatA n=1 Tax=Algisphaera agarilytica TaxID=1385975 RepID=A0A7X0H6B0_9BACT|nr:sec-independent protein translocase protein TatA [Algisphaera agarilytica]